MFSSSCYHSYYCEVRGRYHSYYCEVRGRYHSYYCEVRGRYHSYYCEVAKISMFTVVAILVGAELHQRQCFLLECEIDDGMR